MRYVSCLSHMLRATSQFFSSVFFLLSGGAIRWMVCYRRGLPVQFAYKCKRELVITGRVSSRGFSAIVALILVADSLATVRMTAIST